MYAHLSKYYGILKVFTKNLYNLLAHSNEKKKSEVGRKKSGKVKQTKKSGKRKKCRNPGSNQGPLDLQSNALPTELFRPQL